MAATSAAARKSTTENPADQVREHTERVLDVGRKATVASIDAYERAWTSVADAQERAAEHLRVDWLQAAARTQARATRDTAKLSADFAREIVR